MTFKSTEIGNAHYIKKNVKSLKWFLKNNVISIGLRGEIEWKYKEPVYEALWMLYIYEFLWFISMVKEDRDGKTPRPFARTQFRNIWRSY